MRTKETIIGRIRTLENTAGSYQEFECAILMAIAEALLDIRDQFAKHLDDLEAQAQAQEIRGLYKR